MIMSKLEVKGLYKTLEGVFTLNNLSLTLKEHEVVVILGPSGCGKSTLLHIIAGLIPPDRGKVYIDGRDYTCQTGRVSYMQQKDLLLDSRTIIDNVALPLVLRGIPKELARRQAALHLDDFGLSGFENYYPRQLSGGMKQRAALLRTYLFSSDILLVDEPFAALDAITRRKMHLWLIDLQQRFRSSVLFVTHDIEEALLIASRIYVFSARPAQVRLEIDMQSIPHRPDSLYRLKNRILAELEGE